MKRLPIDIDMLVNLMEIDHREYDVISYLDTEKGRSSSIKKIVSRMNW